ncbi:glycosyl transferase [Microbacterium karelineae]|uniref:glycosyl transferase n=1 Tax=Microbacterium karelineae TaxID=2654283 RepID=UPI0012EACB79|nr:glycosyl transferase [Microbacterium karelineae]
MRFVWAVVAFLAAVGLIGAGVAQLTVLRGPDTITSQIEAPDAESRYTVIDAEVLRAHPGQQELRITGTDEEIFASYGRTADMQAWLSDTTYNHAVLREDPAEGESPVETTLVEPTNEYADTGERVWWNPRDADVWVQQMTADDELVESFSLPDGMSLLIATDGTEPAPSDISVTWQTTVTTPWAGPLIALGCLALLIGLIFWIAGFVHLRRRRGPRRKGSKAARGRAGSTGRKELAAPAKTDAGEEQAAADEAGEAPKGDDQEDAAKSTSAATRRGARRTLLVIPAVAIGGAMLAGCSPSAWPDFAPSPTPTPEPTEAPDTETPALTDAQAQRIVSGMAQVMSDADENNDAEMAEKRLTGAALEMRSTAYDIRKDVEDYAIPTALPDGEVSVLLPQANDGWPRTALMVVSPEDGGDDAGTPTVLMATQSSPWETYKVSYMGSIAASTELPELAPAWLGAALVPPDSSFLQIAPDELAEAYADIVGGGEDSEFAELFDLETDPFLTALDEKRKTTRDTFNETAEGTAEITFDQRAGDTDAVALATFDSGAIVSVSMGDSETLEPTDEDGVIKIPDAPEIQHFVGEDETTTGLTTSYESQLFFYVPAKASDEPIRVLGFSYGLAGSELLPEPEEEEE